MALFTNQEIYIIAKNLVEAFSNKNDKIPVYFYFFIQKNKLLFVQLATEIEEMKNYIIQSYGEYDSEKQTYLFTDENQKKANQEIKNLLEIKQEVNFYQINLSDFIKSNLILSAQQTEAIMFMIRDEGDELNNGCTTSPHNRK